MPGLPGEIRVEAAFGSTPFTASPVWTDITDHVRLADGISITNGRSDEFADVQPGTLGLVLNNGDGRFTWNNPSSPYYPGVRPMCRIRVTLVVPDFNEPPVTITPPTYVGFYPGPDVYPAEDFYPSEA